MVSNNNKKGFTLVEALVALVIMASVFAVVWNWFGTAVITTQKIEHKVAMPNLVDKFIDHLSTQSLKNRRRGSIEFLKYRLDWVAIPAKHSSELDYKRQPAWVIVLFDIDVDVYFEGDLVESWQTQHTDFWRNENYPANSLSVNQ